MKKTKKIISLLLSVLMIITTISALSITSAAAYYESEPNDSRANADSISTNTTVYGVCNTSNDDDYYKFSLSSQGYITITMNHAQLDYGSWYVHLYDTNGNKLYSWYFNATYASNSTEKIGLSAGTYYVDIEYNYNVAGVDYNFKVNYTQSNYWESESNDSRTKADNISVNTTYYGVSNTSSDGDYYKFSLSSQGYITITMNHAQLDYGSWYVNLYDTNGDKLYYWYFDAAYASNSTEKIGLPAGTYYVDIEYNYNVAGVDYNFKVNYTQSNYWESESNDSRTKADNISVNTTYYGVSNTSSDDDYYKFSLSSQGYITITMNHAQLDYGSWYVYLYDTNGNKLYSWKFDATYASNSTEKIGLSAGTYYVDIEYNYNVAGVEYSLVVEQPLFPDVRASDWYFNAVKFNVDKGYFHGYANGYFGPANNIQRQDFVVVLSKIAGADLSAYAGQNGGFADVPTNDYYSAAVAWAKANHILSGYANGKFGVGDPITREQACLIFYNYCNGYINSSSVSSTLSKYPDGGNVSDWARTAVAWAAQNNVVGGNGKLNPAGNANRAEMAQIIMNMSNNGVL